MLILISILLVPFFVDAKPSEMNVVRPLTYAYSTDVHINYEKIGYGDKIILMLHGFGTSLHTWDDIKYLFPNEEYTLYLIDLKGFGNSSKPDDGKYSIQDQANIVVQFIKDVKTDSLYLIGHSYGGAVALLTQISLLQDKSKTKIRKLILIDGLAYVSEIPLFIEFLRIPLFNNLTFLLSSKYRSDYILHRVFYNKNLISKKLIERYSVYYEGNEVKKSVISAAKQINPIGYEEIIDHYKSIRTSCLIIWGNNDTMLPIKDGIKLSKELPNATIKIINECGHVPQEEKPKLTFEIISAFINEK